VLVTASVGVALVAVRAFLPTLRGTHEASDGAPGTAAGDGPALTGAHEPTATMVAFLGTFFDRDFSEEDRLELIDRLSFAMSTDAAVFADYRLLAKHANRLAVAEGARSLASANEVQRHVAIGHLADFDPYSLVSRLMSRMSERYRAYSRIRANIIPSVAWLYRHSGVPWRARGYRRWPGIPGAWTDYVTDQPSQLS
jgi:hypothetical protein